MDKTAASHTVFNVNDSLSTELRTSIRRFVFGRVGNHALAEDLTQDILIKAARAGSSLREVDKLEGWIFRIARNRINDFFRGSRSGDEPFNEKLHAEANGGEIPEVAAKEEADLRNSLRRYIRGVVEELPPHYREALLATEFEGLSQVAYAKRSGISLPAAKSRVQRGRKEVRRIFEECCEVSADRYGNIIAARPRKAKRKDPSCPCD